MKATEARRMIEAYCGRKFPRLYRDVPPEIVRALHLAKRDNCVTHEIRDLCAPYIIPPAAPRQR